MRLEMSRLMQLMMRFDKGDSRQWLIGSGVCRPPRGGSGRTARTGKSSSRVHLSAVFGPKPGGQWHIQLGCPSP